ncbi:Thioredoxin-like_fold domain-containing protein (Fragment) [Durusdinium trenchii]|uniref:ubiquitinyl hydrolase 1 n=1 Tax=Durusdinium trenchii TaxID=1381693 RepID=A0ABP0HDX5_9DINO
MEPRSTELLRKRRDTNEYQFWRLTFDGDMASRPGFGWRQDVPAIHWEVQGVRGADQDIADLTANAFGRELTLGEGLVVQSPADVGKLLERPNCTEEDVLHAARLPTFEETLSPDEAEALMSFLTVPYLQLPLVLDFFASQDRAAYLFNPEHLGQQGAGR